LTGRENIYLNGTILGMTRAEVDRKLEEIVEFAEMAPFIDTPVKRYSSGMTVRLAFAVAAHLEPEILIVDEVLAVGDAAFQKKCLGKMESVAGQGRTILFVSHNMQAVQSLCSRCVLITRGDVTASGEPETVINEYLRGADAKVDTQWKDVMGLGNSEVRLHRLEVYALTGERDSDAFLSKNEVCVELEVWLKQPLSGLCVGFDLIGERGETVLRSYDTDAPPEQFEPLQAGVNILHCVIPPALLNAGCFFIAPRIGIHNQEWIVNGDPLISFKLTLTHGKSAFWNVLHQCNRPGVIAPILIWTRH
jgi:lipopolysaccharide transport system ATP-binding protein